MQVKIFEEKQYTKILIEGDLDAASSVKLDNELEEIFRKEIKKVLIDCSHLSYISSPGVGVFTARISDFLQQEIQLAFFGMNDRVKSVFEILGLADLLPILNSETDAKLLLNVL